MSSLPAVPNVADPQLRTYLRLLREKVVSLEAAQASQTTKTTQIVKDISSSGSSVTLSNASPKPLADAPVAGVINKASRDDHRHPLPTAAEVGADTAGTAATLLDAHMAEADPHPQYAICVSALTQDTAIPDGGVMLIVASLGLVGDYTLSGDGHVVEI